MLDPLPSVNKAYSMVLRVEKQREVQVNYSENTEIGAVLAKTQTYKREAGRGNYKKPEHHKRDKDGEYCEHCNRTGHMKERYFKLHGFPDWYKKLKEQQGNKLATRNFVNAVDTQLKS